MIIINILFGNILMIFIDYIYCYSFYLLKNVFLLLFIQEKKTKNWHTDTNYLPLGERRKKILISKSGQLHWEIILIFYVMKKRRKFIFWFNPVYNKFNQDCSVLVLGTEKVSYFKKIPKLFTVVIFWIQEIVKKVPTCFTTINQNKILQ